MGPSAKILSLVTTAIKNLQEMKGSTSKEILNYITHLTNLSSDKARRQMNTALKRGVEYGIIRKKGCQYTLPTDAECECQEIAAQELGLVNLRCRRRRKEERRTNERKERHGRGNRRQGRMKACTCKKKRRERRRACRAPRRSRGKRARRRRGARRCRCPVARRSARRSAYVDEKGGKPPNIAANNNENEPRMDSNSLVSRGRNSERNARLSCERNTRGHRSLERNSRERSSSSSKESDNPLLN